MKIYNSFNKALEVLEDKTVCFADKNQQNIITLTPLIMDGSLEYFVFPEKMKDEIEKEDVDVYALKGFIKHGWIEPYSNEEDEDVDDVIFNVKKQIEALITSS